jgi:VCBS repeat-containing protein
VEQGAAQFNAASVSGQYGDLSIDDHGDWTYNLHSGVTPQPGHIFLDHIEVNSADGTAHNIYISVGDAPGPVHIPAPPPPVSADDAPDSDDIHTASTHTDSPVDDYMALAGVSADHHNTAGDNSPLHDYMDMADHDSSAAVDHSAAGQHHDSDVALHDALENTGDIDHHSDTAHNGADDYMHTLGVDHANGGHDTAHDHQLADLDHDMAAMHDTSGDDAGIADHHDPQPLDDLPPDFDQPADDQQHIQDDDSHHMM